MRTRGKAAACALVLTVATALTATMALAGCVQNSPIVIPTSDPSVKPVFKSDADALAAAKKTYDGYLAASDEVAHDGGINVGRISAFETAAEYGVDAKNFALMRSQGSHTSGQSAYRDFRLQSSTVSASGDSKVIAYVCFDISHTELVGKSGANIGANRPPVLPLVVTFVSAKDDPSTLIISRSVTWSGKNFC